MTCEVRNPGPGLGQAQTCCRVKPVKGIQTFPLLIIASQTGNADRCQQQIKIWKNLFPLQKDYILSQNSKFVSDLQQVGGFLRILQFPPPIKLTATI